MRITHQPCGNFIRTRRLFFGENQVPRRTDGLSSIPHPKSGIDLQISDIPVDISPGFSILMRGYYDH